MLPRALYEILPYLYISIGLSTSLTISTSAIVVAAALLISAGIVILSMRFNYRKTLKSVLPAVANELGSDRNFVVRKQADRRQAQVSHFPLIDNIGEMISGDRRTGDRRTLAA